MRFEMREKCKNWSKIFFYRVKVLLNVQLWCKLIRELKVHEFIILDKHEYVFYNINKSG